MLNYCIFNTFIFSLIVFDEFLRKRGLKNQKIMSAKDLLNEQVSKLDVVICGKNYDYMSCLNVFLRAYVLSGNSSFFYELLFIDSICCLFPHLFYNGKEKEIYSHGK